MRTLIAILILAATCSAASAGEWSNGNAIYVNGRFVGVSVGRDWYHPQQVIWSQPRCDYGYNSPGLYGSYRRIEPPNFGRGPHIMHDLNRWTTNTGYGQYR